MKRKFLLLLLYGLLIAGAIANYETVTEPERRLTPFFRNHVYQNSGLIPVYETDAPATAIRLLGINAALILAISIVFVAGGISLLRPLPLPINATEQELKKPYEVGPIVWICGAFLFACLLTAFIYIAMAKIDNIGFKSMGAILMTGFGCSSLGSLFSLALPKDVNLNYKFMFCLILTGILVALFSGMDKPNEKISILYPPVKPHSPWDDIPSEPASSNATIIREH